MCARQLRCCNTQKASCGASEHCWGHGLLQRLAVSCTGCPAQPHLQNFSSWRPACCSCQRARHWGCTLRGHLQGATSWWLPSSEASSRQIQHMSLSPAPAPAPSAAACRGTAGTHARGRGQWGPVCFGCLLLLGVASAAPCLQHQLRQCACANLQHPCNAPPPAARTTDHWLLLLCTPPAPAA